MNHFFAKTSIFKCLTGFWTWLEHELIVSKDFSVAPIQNVDLTHSCKLWLFMDFIHIWLLQTNACYQMLAKKIVAVVVHATKASKARFGSWNKKKRKQKRVDILHSSCIYFLIWLFSSTTISPFLKSDSHLPKKFVLFAALKALWKWWKMLFISS